MGFFIVRHARVNYPAGACYGATDVPVDAAHTVESAQALALVLPANALVLSSPLERCRALAAELNRRRPDLPFTLDPRLQEMNFGVWEGQPWDAIPRRMLDAWTASFGDYRCGGGESVSLFLARIAAVWDETAELREAESAAVVWICHAGVARAVQYLLRGERRVGPASKWPKQGLAHGELWHVC